MCSIQGLLSIRKYVPSRHGGGQAKTSSDLNLPVDFCFILELGKLGICAVKLSLHAVLHQA